MAASKGRISNEALLRAVNDMRTQIGRLEGLIMADMARRSPFFANGPTGLVPREMPGIVPERVVEPEQTQQSIDWAKKRAEQLKRAVDLELEKRAERGIGKDGNAITPDDEKAWNEERI